jgi:hypothetical protein
MKKWIALAAALVLLLVGYVAAGPFLAIRGIQASLQDRDLGRLERHVDFETLRGNLRGQVESRLAKAAEGIGGGTFAGAAREFVGQISGHAVDAMVSPTGIAVLLEGRSLSRRITGGADAGAPPTDPGQPAAFQPLSQAETRFESPTRFTATTTSAEGKPVVFVFELQGLRWRLTDVRLPA